ncbi:hypothetical protein ACXJJ3_32895 [Kribbella sp. WER1]
MTNRIVTSKPDADNERAFVNVPIRYQSEEGVVAVVGAYKGVGTGYGANIDREDAVALRDKLTELIEKHDAEQPLFQAGDFVTCWGQNALVLSTAYAYSDHVAVRSVDGIRHPRPADVKKVTVQ